MKDQSKLKLGSCDRSNLISCGNYSSSIIHMRCFSNFPPDINSYTGLCEIWTATKTADHSFYRSRCQRYSEGFSKHPYLWTKSKVHGFWLQVSDKDFSITLNAYFIVKWSDSRCRLIYKKCRNTALRPSLRAEFFKQKIEPTLIIAWYMLAKRGPP